MSNRATCVALCDSIHDVMRAEKLLKARGIWRDLVPTPRQLSSNCGMALALHEQDLSAALKLLEDAGLNHRLYRETDVDYEPLQ